MMSTETTRGPATISVQKTVVVDVPREHAFDVFTRDISKWWPLQSHSIGSKPTKAAVIEPFEGGRWYEQGVDGSECDWGQVLVWEPPSRIVLSWEISCNWQHDSSISTLVEVRFVELGENSTRVELDHRQLESYDNDAEKMRSIFDSEGGWAGILEHYRQAANAGTDNRLA
jgi:uncharacterized protein YndB with AHSA1/START domain